MESKFAILAKSGMKRYGKSRFDSNMVTTRKWKDPNRVKRCDYCGKVQKPGEKSLTVTYNWAHFPMKLYMCPEHGGTEANFAAWVKWDSDAPEDPLVLDILKAELFGEGE
jgi:hypothetical protein